MDKNQIVAALREIQYGIDADRYTYENIDRLAGCILSGEQYMTEENDG